MVRMRLSRLASPILLVALAAGVMFFRLADKALWNDEAFSFFVAQHGIAATVRFIAQDTQPPVYYLVLSQWLRLGHGIFALRALSALAMALAVVPLYGAARRLLDARTATIAGILFALTPMVANWAQKARAYALQTFLLSIAFWGFAVIFTAPEARRDWIGQGLLRAARTRDPRAAVTDLGWLAVGLGGGLAMLTQQPAGFFLLGLNVAAALAALPRPAGRWRWLANWTVSQLLVVAVWLTWLPWFLAQIRTNLTPAQIALRHTNFLTNWGGVIGSLQGLFGVSSLWRAAPLFLAVQLVAAVLGAVALIRAGRAIPVLVPLLVPPIVCVAGFWLIHPVFGYVIGEFVFSWLPYAVLLAAAASRARPRVAAIALVTMILAGDLWGLRNYYESPNQPTDRVAAMIRGRMRPGDGVILSDNVAMRWVLAYYLGPARQSALAGLDTSAEWDFDRLIRTLPAALRQRRDWVVLPGGQPSSVPLASLRARMRQVSIDHIGAATVLLFARKTAANRP